MKVELLDASSNSLLLFYKRNTPFIILIQQIYLFKMIKLFWDECRLVSPTFGPQ